MLNHIVLQGRLARDPELRHTQSGVAVCSFTLAVERDVAAEGGTRKADFIDCSAWRGSADFVSKHFRKGSAAVVSGRLQINDWTDREGIKHKSATVQIDSIYFGESKKDDNKNAISGAGAQENSAAAYNDGTANFTELPDLNDSDLPF